MNCPGAFTALAKRQAFQREQTCERASGSRVTEEASVHSLATLGDRKRKGTQTWLSYRREEEEEKEEDRSS